MTTRSDRRPARLRQAARVLLGGVLMFAGVGHLSFARKEFQAQVPSWVPADPDRVVLASGVVEIVLGTAAAAFFVAVLPGNIAQLRHHRDGFGLDTDAKRALRLLGQPLLVAWAIWATRTERPFS